MEDIDLHWLNQAIPLAAFFAFVALFSSCFQAIWSNYLFHISSILFTFYLFIHALNEPYICYTEQQRKFMKRKSFPLIPVQNHLSSLQQAKRNYPPFFLLYPKSIEKSRDQKRKDEEWTRPTFREKEIYTNGNLTITDVAALLGTNRTYVSNVINNEFGFSFYQFVTNTGYRKPRFYSFNTRICKSRK